MRRTKLSIGACRSGGGVNTACTESKGTRRFVVQVSVLSTCAADCLPCLVWLRRVPQPVGTAMGDGLATSIDTVTARALVAPLSRVASFGQAPGPVRCANMCTNDFLFVKTLD